MLSLTCTSSFQCQGFVTIFRTYSHVVMQSSIFSFILFGATFVVSRSYMSRRSSDHNLLVPYLHVVHIRQTLSVSIRVFLCFQGITVVCNMNYQYRQVKFTFVKWFLQYYAALNMLKKSNQALYSLFSSFIIS